jgi:antitoxin (DNA-binding transcriptional repressor) of toxin-antitoxin stability system
LTSRINQARIAIMKIASISELKDGLSAHLELVRSGELVVVTDRKSPVATLERIAPGTLAGETAGLVSEGIAAPRKTLLDVQAFLTMPPGRSQVGLAAAILDDRQEEER